jgi:hypothetical protein
MISRSRATLSTLLGAALVAAVLTGCGNATSTAGRSAIPSPAPVGAPTPLATAIGAAPGSSSAITSPGAAGSPGSSASVGPCDDPSALATDPLSLPHVNAKLEDQLPSIIGGVCLQKLSFTLQAYMNSTSGGDNGLYPTWLIKFNKTPAEVVMAIAADLTGQENFVMHAIEVPDADADALSSGFAAVARNAGWTVSSHANLMSTGKTVLEIIDPVAKAAGGLSAGYVYARGDVLYTIITDSPSLLLETLIHMP